MMQTAERDQSSAGGAKPRKTAYMQTPEKHFIELVKGQAAGVSVVHLGRSTRIVIHERDENNPPIQIIFSESERGLLMKALQNPAIHHSELRRPFRTERSARTTLREEI